MRSTNVEKSVLELDAGSSSPDRGRVCVRGENEEGRATGGQGIQRSCFHAIYYTLGSRNSVTCQPKAAMFLMC
jgi:hypothetical protein